MERFFIIKTIIDNKNLPQDQATDRGGQVLPLSPAMTVCCSREGTSASVFFFVCVY